METNELINQRFGKCKIKRFLNRGGYGYSFIGWDEGIEKNRVVKVSKVPIGSAEYEKNEIENFRREGLILSRLKHPQIVTLIEQGEEHGYYYMILDYIEGFDFKSVFQVLKQRKDELRCKWGELMDPVTALAIIISSLEPLSYAHKAKIQLPGQKGFANGLAHRDISPGNLMLGEGYEYEGKVHLIDFGIAKTNIPQSNTMSTAIIGSATYISPARLMKQRKSEEKGTFWYEFQQTQHDIHAMGVILYKLLSGNNFVEADDLLGVIAQIQTPKVYQILYKNITIFDEGIQDIIKKSIVFPDIKKNKGPYQYKTASEMKFALEIVYNTLSGGAPIKDILSHFAREIKEPRNLQPKKKFSSRAAMYSKTKKVGTGFSQSSKFTLKEKLWVFSALLIAILIAWLGIHNPNNLNLKELFLEGEIWKSEQIKNTKKREVKSSQSEIKQAKFESDKGLLVKRPAHSIVTKEKPKIKKKSPPKKKQIAKSKTKREKANIKKLYNAIRTKIISGNKQGAYVSVKKALAKSEDPAFMLLKAYLIHERNPVSKEKERLIIQSLGKKSLVMSEKEMKDMRARMK